MGVSNLATYLKYYGHYGAVKLLNSHKKNQIDDNALEIELVSSSISVRAVHPYMEEDNLKKIPAIASDEWGDRSYAAIVQSFKVVENFFEECRVYHFSDAFINQSWLFSGNMRYTFNWNAESSLKIPRNIREYNIAVMSNTYFSSRYWGHWLSQEFPLQRLLSGHGPFIGYLPRKGYRDECFWRNMIALPNVDTAESFLCKHLVMCDSPTTSIACIRQHNEIRKILQSKKESKGKKVYIKRGNDGQRRSLTNEEELISKLSAEGFISVDINSIDVNELVELLTGASVVMGVEGSHLQLAMYTLSTHGLLLILQPPGRVTRNITDACLNLGIPSAMYVCNQVEGSEGDEFSINVDEFMGFFSRAGEWAEKTHDEINQYANQILST